MHSLRLSHALRLISIVCNDCYYVARAQFLYMFQSIIRIKKTYYILVWKLQVKTYSLFIRYR